MTSDLFQPIMGHRASVLLASPAARPQCRPWRRDPSFSPAYRSFEAVSNAFADVIEAAKLKAQHAISYADAFAAATAIRRGAVLVTGDPEFRALEGTVTLKWI
jgi:predicted nucleic acid-binding protein